MLAYDDMFVRLNLGEAVLWWLFSLVFVVFAFRLGKTGRLRYVAAAFGMLMFGLSDVVESKTGAWYRPWWLLAWKACCLLLFLALGFAYWNSRRRSADGTLNDDDSHKQSR